MDITIHPGKLIGKVPAISSKSMAHRLLICAALADLSTQLHCSNSNNDIEATVNCLNALGANITRCSDGYSVIPIVHPPHAALLDCKESGSTLRFLLPVVGALGVDAVFHMEGRLPNRPLSPLWEEMVHNGCHLNHSDETSIQCTGKLNRGCYKINGHISSQFISGLLFALPLLDGSSQLQIEGKLESQPYVDMTIHALNLFGIHAAPNKILGGQHFISPGRLTVEGDWSNSAFFYAANSLGSRITVSGLDRESLQGDKAIVSLLPKLTHFSTVSVRNIPDLVPILAVVAGAYQGAVFTDIQRLRLKESDRVASVIAMLQSIGGYAKASENELHVFGTGYTGGTVNSMNDHRIAMAAAIAATICSQPVTVTDAQCVKKSYPEFWNDYQRLGGKL